MQPTFSDKINKRRRERSTTIKRNYTKDMNIIETTYDKVLGIINNVKEFLRQNMKNSQKLVNDLKWVIKVISNKSLYKYELRRPEFSRQNSEFNKFINFVTKYNEEILEMNKRHFLVSGILNLVKKQEMLSKPSLCLKRILPEELENMDLKKEKEKRLKKKNFINLLGNAILKIYYRALEKKKLEGKLENEEEKEDKYKTNVETNENNNKSNIENNDNNENNINNNKDNINNNKDNNINNKEYNINNNKDNNINNNNKENNINNNKENNINNKENNINNKENNINNNKDNNMNNKENNNKGKFEQDTYNKNDLVIIQKFNIIDNDSKNNTINTEKFVTINNKKYKKKKIIDEKNKRNNNSKYKLLNYTTNYETSRSTSRRKNKNLIKLTKNGQPALIKIKNAMENYYLKNHLIEHREFNVAQNYNLNKSKNKANLNGVNHKPNKSSYIERGAVSKNSKNEYLTTKHKKNKDEDDNKDRTLYLKNLDIHIKKRLLKSCNDNNFFNKLENHNKNNSYMNKNAKKLNLKNMNTLEYNRNNLNNLNLSYNKRTIKNYIKSKIMVQKKIQENNSNNSNNNNDERKNNNYNDKEENNISIKEEKIPIKNLLDLYFEDIKNIIDKDFDIFDFKSKVGYKNVFPLMCYCILKTLGLLDNRIIVMPKLESFLQCVNDNYKESTLYHNSLHGADVTQSLCVYFINSNAEEICETSVLDLLGIIVSAMGHDLGHPGLTNNFHINAQTDLAMTYNDISCLENYHTSFLFKILKKDENNIFGRLSVENFKSIRKRMINQILATDMANHGEVLSLIKTKVKTFQEHEKEREREKEGEGEGEGEGEEEDRFSLLSGNEKTKFDEQQVLLNYLIHSADLGHNCKKYEISKKWVRLLCEEFWIQGDKEKSLGIPVSFLCDRDKIDVPTSQVNFLRGFILSSFDCLGTIFPKLKYTVENAKNNIKEWQKLLDEHRVTGWTPNNETSDEDEEEDESDD